MNNVNAEMADLGITDLIEVSLAARDSLGRLGKVMPSKDAEKKNIPVPEKFTLKISKGPTTLDFT
jgi:hypothetical protein